jgi:hypothetical protein
MHGAVAKSIQVFSSAIRSGNFERDLFETVLQESKDLELFLNDDTVLND